MQTIDDLKEILTAAQEFGISWREEIISLRAENSRLQKENETLRENYGRLHEDNEKLRNELNNLSEKNEQLNQNLRDEIAAVIAKELNAEEQDKFQNFVKDYLKDIRERIGNEPTKNFEEPPGNENTSVYNMYR